MALGRPPARGPRVKGYIMPAARRELELFPPRGRQLTHAGPWPHANRGRRLQLCQSRRQQRREADALIPVPATQLKARRKRSRVRRSLMHEWKYQEAAAERLSPGAVQRLRARFAAVLHGDLPVSCGHEATTWADRGGSRLRAAPAPPRRPSDGTVPSPVARAQSDKLESLWRAAVAESQPRYEGVLRERGSGNASHVPPPQPRRRGSDGSGGDGGGDGGDGSDDSKGGVAEQPPTPFSEPGGSSTPFSEHAATLPRAGATGAPWPLAPIGGEEEPPSSGVLGGGSAGNPDHPNHPGPNPSPNPSPNPNPNPDPNP